MKTAYPNLNQPVSITLFSNIPFDNTYKDHTLISNKFSYRQTLIPTTISQYADQERFLYRRVSGSGYVYPHWTLSGDFNFDFKNGLIGSVVLELTIEQTNANYMKVQCGSDKYYYFITSITQNNFGTYTLALELDVIATYTDDFLEGIKGIPVFTKRKHCKRTFNGFAYSKYYKNGDSTFGDVKPSLIEDKLDTELYYGSNTTIDSRFKDIMWLYICVPSNQLAKYFIKGVENPFAILCVPVRMGENEQDIITNVRFEYFSSTSPNAFNYNISVRDVIQNLVGDGTYKSCKLLPYPPFTNCDNIDIELEQNFGGFGYTLSFRTLEENIFTKTIVDSTHTRYDLHFGNNVLRIREGTSSDIKYPNWLELYLQNDYVYNFDELFYQDFTISDVPINQPRNTDPKLLFKPFKKYCISSASGEEQEFYPELLTSLSPFRNNDNQALYLSTIATGYAGDFSTFTYINEVQLRNSVIGWANYKYGKIGLSTTMNYTIPVGENALEVFKSTQSETYYQSKIASGITSGLTIAGGVGSIALGVAGAVGSMGMSTPMSIGLIASGVGAVASGTAGVANTIKSTNAKIEDLKNTPNSINVSGSSYAHDIAMEINKLLPYVVIYTCSDSVLHTADDYFYTYGYEVSRDTYFNLVITGDNLDDVEILNRTIFNYVQIQDDITTKIRSDIPLIVKQKLSNILNQGITLWTFFGFRSLYPLASSSTHLSPFEPPTYNLDSWLFKHTLENKEYKGEYYE